MQRVEIGEQRRTASSQKTYVCWDVVAKVARSSGMTSKLDRVWNSTPAQSRKKGAVVCFYLSEASQRLGRFASSTSIGNGWQEHMPRLFQNHVFSAFRTPISQPRHSSQNPKSKHHFLPTF